MFARTLGTYFDWVLVWHVWHVWLGSYLFKRFDLHETTNKWWSLPANQTREMGDKMTNENGMR